MSRLQAPVMPIVSSNACGTLYRVTPSKSMPKTPGTTPNMPTTNPALPSSSSNFSNWFRRTSCKKNYVKYIYFWIFCLNYFSYITLISIMQIEGYLNTPYYTWVSSVVICLEKHIYRRTLGSMHRAGYNFTQLTAFHIVRHTQHQHPDILHEKEDDQFTKKKKGGWSSVFCINGCTESFL